MTQIEFIDKLNICLTGKVSVSTVQDNLNYYRQYFSEELRKGRSEENICASLGSPQLIAKGILEAERFQSDSSAEYENDVREEYHTGSGRSVQNSHNFRLPGWLFGLIAIFLFFIVIGLVLSVFSALAPIILPICIVLFVVQIFKNNF